MPAPKILNIDLSDRLVVSGVSNNEKYEKLSRKFRIYGEKYYAKQVALENDVLNKANKQVINIFKNFSNLTGVEIEVVTSDVPECDLGFNSFFPKRYPLEIKYPKTLEIDNVNNYLTLYAGNLFDVNNNKNRIFIRPVSVVKFPDFHFLYDNARHLFPFNGNEFRNTRYLFNYKSLKDENTIKVYFCDYFDGIGCGDFCGIENNCNSCMLFIFEHDNKKFALEVTAVNHNDLLEFTPLALNVVYNIRKSNIYENANQIKDIYGITKEEWMSANVSEHRNLIREYFDMSDYGSKIVFLPDTINSIPILTDNEGEDCYKDNSKKFKNELSAIVRHLQEKYNVNFDDAIFILFDYNRAHRDRCLIFFKDKLVFFTPERTVLKFKIQNEVFDEIEYHEIFIDNKISYEDGKYCFGADDKCIDKIPFSYLFGFLREKGFISLFE